MMVKNVSISSGKEWDGKLKAHLQTFSSMNEAMRYIRAMPMSDHNVDSQFFQNGYVNDDEEWNGFKDLDDLVDICQNGVHDMDEVMRVMKYAQKAVVEEKDKLVRKTKDVAGGSVDVPTFLSGSPECMNGLKRAKVKSKIVKVAVNCEVLSDISVSQYIRAGTSIAKTVVALEKAGYRVKLVTSAGIWDLKNSVAMMSVVIKRESDAVNWRRMLMPMMSTAFWRGLAFNWVSALPDFYPGWGLGQRIDQAFQRDYREEGMKKLTSIALVDDDFCRFSINDVIQMGQRNPPAVVESFLRAKMLALDA